MPRPSSLIARNYAVTVAGQPRTLTGFHGPLAFLGAKSSPPLKTRSEGSYSHMKKNNAGIIDIGLRSLSITIYLKQDFKQICSTGIKRPVVRRGTHVPRLGLAAIRS